MKKNPQKSGERLRSRIFGLQLFDSSSASHPGSLAQTPLSIFEDQEPENSMEWLWKKKPIAKRL